MIQVTELSACCAPSRERFHQHLGQLLKEAWWDYRKSFRRCRAKFSEDSVHQLRVESRRLLALLNLLETLVGPAHIVPPRRLVKKILGRLARLRDTQVQLLYVEAKLKSFPEARAFRNALRGRERRLVRRVGARMRCTRIGRIKSGMAGLRKAVRRVLADQAHEQAHRQTVLRSVNQAFARVVALRDRCRADDLATIHRLRIAFKAFRYVVELLQPVLPGVTKRKLDTLHAFQNRLGEIQDADVLVAALDKFSLKHPENAAAVEAFHRDAERRRSLLVREFLANADRIHQFWPPHPPGLNHTRRPARRIRSSSQRHRC